jgi:hypothetical protein
MKRFWDWLAETRDAFVRFTDALAVEIERGMN